MWPAVLPQKQTATGFSLAAAPNVLRGLILFSARRPQFLIIFSGRDTDIGAGPDRVLFHDFQAFFAKHLAFADFSAAFHAIHSPCPLFTIQFIVQQFFRFVKSKNIFHPNNCAPEQYTQFILTHFMHPVESVNDM
jgi:hypothetical protein